MKAISLAAAISTLLLLSQFAPGQDSPDPIPNKLIDYPGFLETARQVEDYREMRRVSAEDFLEMARDDETIILDSRSAEAYKKLHVAGAVHLNFSDMTKERLAKVIPSKDTRVLIYCNNNFKNEPEAFPSKMVRAALNIPTFITLFEYNYRNVYELGPVIDSNNSPLPLVSGEQPGDLPPAVNRRPQQLQQQARVLK